MPPTLNPLNILLFVANIARFIWPITGPVCQQTLVASVQRMFIHSGLPHLLINLWTFWQLQTRPGPTLAIMFLVTLSDHLVYGAGLMRCAVGFSGVVYGLFAYRLLQISRGFNGNNMWELAMALVAGLFIPNISVIGHLLGAASGALVWSAGV